MGIIRIYQRQCRRLSHQPPELLLQWHLDKSTLGKSNKSTHHSVGPSTSINQSMSLHTWIVCSTQRADSSNYKQCFFSKTSGIGAHRSVQILQKHPIDCEAQTHGNSVSLQETRHTLTKPSPNGVTDTPDLSIQADYIDMTYEQHILQ